MQGDAFAFRNLAISQFLGTINYISPLSLLLYVWPLLEVLENKVQSVGGKRLYRALAAVLIFILPLALFGTYIPFVLNTSKYLEYYLKLEFKKAEPYKTSSHKLSQTIGYLTLLCNLSSCMILSLILRLFYTTTRSVSYGKEAIKEKHKLNSAVTISHILLVFGYTVVSTLHFNVPQNDV